MKGIMAILDQLSSQVGDRTEEANRGVVAQCLANPDLLAEVAGGLGSREPALVGDCAEVLTEVAKEHPEWVAPYAQVLSMLLAHKKTRVRWEAMHALALVTTEASQVVAPLLPQLGEIIRSDESTIVRDYAVDAVGNYARTGMQAAKEAYPVLKEALSVWSGKHAAHALDGLANVAVAAPGLGDEIRVCGQRYLDHSRGVVRKAAKALLKALKAE